MATHSSILAWRILWTQEPSGLQFMGSQRIRHDSATEHTHMEAEAQDRGPCRFGFFSGRRLSFCAVTWSSLCACAPGASLCPTFCFLQGHQSDKIKAQTQLTPWAPLVAHMAKNPPLMLETWVRSLPWEDPLEKGMATHSSILAWKIPWTEEPGRLRFPGEGTGYPLQYSGLENSMDRGAWQAPVHEVAKSWT